MNRFQYMADAYMCLLWIITYTVALIATVRYKKPSLPPATQAVIAPFEFAVLIKMIVSGSFGIGYIPIAYGYWTLIEILIVIALIKTMRMSKMRVAVYSAVILLMTCLMFYLIYFKEYTFFFSYFNTFIGEIFWFAYIFKKDYPMKALNLIAFIAKFVGDAISIPVYLNNGPLLIDFICILLPVLDFVFIVTYFIKRNRTVRAEEKDTDYYNVH